MKLERFEKIEALASAIEEQELLIHENNALTAYYERLEQGFEQRFRDADKKRLLYFLKENTIRWKSWLAESSNAYTHNAIFYRNRLKVLLEE